MAIKYCKLVSGDEIIGEFTENMQDPKSLNVKAPVALGMDHDGKLMTMPWLPYVDHTNGINLSTDKILVGPMNIPKPLAEHYEKCVNPSPIITPPRKLSLVTDI